MFYEIRKTVKPIIWEPFSCHCGPHVDSSHKNTHQPSILGVHVCEYVIFISVCKKKLGTETDWLDSFPTSFPERAGREFSVLPRALCSVLLFRNIILSPPSSDQSLILVSYEASFPVTIFYGSHLSSLNQQTPNKSSIVYKILGLVWIPVLILSFLNYVDLGEPLGFPVAHFSLL